LRCDAFAHELENMREYDLRGHYMSNATVGSVHTLSKTKIAVAIAAAAALAMAPILLQGSIAHAQTIPVVEADVHPTQIGGDGTAAGYNYGEWHIGTTDSTTTPATPVDP